MRLLFLLFLLALAPCIQAQTNDAPSVRQLGPGRLQVGSVTIDALARTLTFPAKVNMTEGLVEYWLVHQSGKVHESVFATDVRANDIHIGALLLSGRSQATNSPNAALGEALPINIFVSWPNPKNAQEVIELRAESLIQNTEKKAEMTPGTWTYNGSRVVDGLFIAHRDGSLVAIMADQDALINNPRPGRENDEIWRIGAGKGLPPVGTPVDIRIEFPKGEKKE